MIDIECPYCEGRGYMYEEELKELRNKHEKLVSDLTENGKFICKQRNKINKLVEALKTVLGVLEEGESYACVSRNIEVIEQALNEVKGDI